MPFDFATYRLLAKEYGDAFFLLDERGFEKNLRDFLAQFQALYPRTSLGYSYKTNYLPRLGQIVQTAGQYAEVVSAMEYDLARRLGVPGDRIIFNGPLKLQPELTRAMLEGAQINLDGLEELELAASIAAQHPQRQFGIGLRCNLDLGERRISRFGFDTNSPDLDAAVKRLRALPNLELTGLHCHLSTSGRTVESYRLRTEQLLKLADRYFPEAPPQYLDVGGGFYGKVPPDLRAQFSHEIPDYSQYAAVIAPLLKQRYGEQGPELILEPGVAVVSDVLRFVTTVVGLKTIRGRQLALVVGSIHNVKPTGTEIKLALELLANPDASRQLDGLVDLVGYTCMEHDCLYPEYHGAVRLGDIAVFHNMGAYTLVFKPPFIRPNPPIVGYDSNSERYTLLRREETMADVFATYMIEGAER
jgi:diaminopimelate decarboxylase